MTSYELGINDARVGRLLPREPSGVYLEFSPTHPMLQWCAESTKTNLCTDRVREANEADHDGWKQISMDVVGLFSPLPRWNEALLLDDGRSDAARSDRIEFTLTASILFVGIGQALRDELAHVRYIGPARDLHPQTTTVSSARRRALETFAADFVHGGGAVGSRPSYHAPWADGSEAWTYLQVTPHRDFLDAVNTWIERRDRLDTGYALRVRSKVTIYEDEAGLVSEMREYHRLRQTFGEPDGGVDLGGWVRAKAAAVIRMTDPDGTRAALKRCDQLREKFASADGASIIASVDKLFEAALQDVIEKFGGPEPIDIEPGIRREAERNLRLAEDVRRLLRLTTQEIASQITEAGEDVAGSSEPLTPAYGGRMNDLLRRWESNAPKWIYAAGVFDGLRAMHVPEDLPDELEAWTRRIEDARTLEDLSVEVERFLAEFRRALQASVASTRRNYRRLTALVSSMEGGRFSSQEIEALAAEIAARPPQREIDLLTTRNAVPVRIADVGVGISQVLPVVVAALDPDRPGVTAIEQPELHLHPRIQVELGDLFASQAAKGGIFLIETHSEHLLLRFMKRMRQTSDGTLGNGNPRMRPVDIAVYFVEIDPPRHGNPDSRDAAQRARRAGQGMAGRILRRRSARDILMPLLAEYAITPDVLDLTSYSNANECEARLDYIKETILNAGLVRDLHDGLWSALFGPRGHQMHDHATAGTPAPASDAGARTWHRRGTELVRKLTSQNRLVRYRPARPDPPTDDAEWCAEALATHAAQPFTGGVIVTEAVKGHYATEQIVARIDRLSSADWWRRRQHCSARLDRTLADYETHLDAVLRCSNSLMFIDPHLDPTEPRYAGFARLLHRAGSRIPAPLVEIHRRDPPDRQKFERRFRDALMAPLRSAGLKARVCMWATGTRFHDRYLISNLVGILLPDGFDTGKGRTTWTRLGRDDRDDVQREFDQGSRRHRLVRSFELS